MIYKKYINSIKNDNIKNNAKSLYLNVNLNIDKVSEIRHTLDNKYILILNMYHNIYFIIKYININKL